MTRIWNLLGGVMMQKILIATDGSKHSERAAEVGTEMAKLYGAAITILYVMDVNKEYASLGDMISRVVDDLISNIRANLQNQGDLATTRVQEMAERAGILAEIKIIEGYPAEEIIRTAEEGNMDLIVVGGIGATGLDKFLLGSVADKVVRNSKVPVLVVRND
jgi:nucleotide-binding universal stress UspA family protein